MSELGPWSDPDWVRQSEARADAALAAAGRPRVGPFETIKVWGRSCLQTVLTDNGLVWIKHSYRLPPGEEKVLEVLAQRWGDRVPTIVATWTGAMAMDPLPGRELTIEDDVEQWKLAARTLAELAEGEIIHTEEWLAAGVRDRGPPVWREAVESLLESPVVRGVEPDVLKKFELLVPDFITRYIEAFVSPATLVHQDSGCCNIHLSAGGPIIFDWADVVVGHAAFSCDRLLDQVPPEHREAVIEAFLDPLEVTRAEFDGMRRSNVLHEVLRYHDELKFLPPQGPTHASLAKSVRSQICVLVAHEWARRK